MAKTMQVLRTKAVYTWLVAGMAVTKHNLKIDAQIVKNQALGGSIEYLEMQYKKMGMAAKIGMGAAAFGIQVVIALAATLIMKMVQDHAEMMMLHEQAVASIGEASASMQQAYNEYIKKTEEAAEKTKQTWAKAMAESYQTFFKLA